MCGFEARFIHTGCTRPNGQAKTRECSCTVTRLFCTQHLVHCNVCVNPGSGPGKSLSIEQNGREAELEEEPQDSLDMTSIGLLSACNASNRMTDCFQCTLHASSGRQTRIQDVFPHLHPQVLCPEKICPLMCCSNRGGCKEPLMTLDPQYLGP